MKNKDAQLLKQFINEVAMSPSVRTNKVLDDPMQSKNVADNFNKMMDAYSNALMLNLTVLGFDTNYNPQTRDFNDAAYEKIKQTVEQATKVASDAIKAGLKDTWQKMHASASQKPEQQAQQAPKQVA